MRDWQECKAEEVFDLVGGYAFKGEDFIASGVPVIKIKNIKANYFSEHEFAYVSEEFLGTRKDKLARPNDLLISMSGNRHDGNPETWVGKVAQYRKNSHHFINQRVGALRVKYGANLNPRFAAYVLSSWPYQEHFISIATSSGGQANLSPSQILGVTIPIPPLQEQKAIAAILGALDDKIELNRRMNATLEAMARALFKSWFVDFDPVRAKMAGKQPFSMDAATAALFPSRLTSSPLGDIPEGWAIDEIGNVVTAVGGSTPSTEKPEYWAGGHHAWATPKDLSNLKSPVLLTTERQITDAGIGVISSGLLPAGTVLMSSRAPIGYIAIAEVPVAINQGFIAMVCNKKLPNLYVWLWTHNNLDTIKNHSNGSTFQEISKGSFRPLPCIVPTDHVLQTFQEIISPTWQKIVSNTKETVSLEKQRDYLLPKLISGDIRIPDAEKFVEAA